jgi:23S rRNA (cytidine1920-2'-O)/16S rRNA (cytidine1409-2'-O)-methyltransferase
LVRRGLAASRTAAQRAIDDGRVVLGGVPATKSATLVAPGDAIAIESGDHEWASRGAHKLLAGLDAFGVETSGRHALDVGASTGGFTDVLLQREAASVVAVDVGYGQLVWRLQTHPRVTVHDRTNFRLADPAELGAPFDVVVVDVSFISIGLLAPNLASSGRTGTDYVILVKPQFEAGREAVGRTGVVRESGVRIEAALTVADALAQVNIGARDVVRSPITGAQGNVEILLHGVLDAPRILRAEQVEEACT